MDKTVANGKAEIEAFVENRLRDAGLESLSLENLSKSALPLHNPILIDHDN